jgi:hypothetical protein
MKKLCSLVGSAVLSMMATACGGASDENGTASPVNGTAGTSGMDDVAAPPAAEPAERADAPQPAALPATASPLPLVGALGALLVGGAIGLRRYLGPPSK